MPKIRIPLTQATAMLRSLGDSLETFARTAPDFVASIGGQAGLASRCEMTAIGPLPRLTPEEFERVATEYGDQAGWTGYNG